jgi:putative ubiquitin-RnfH superfamily antitoxin RatB of RatAB toxin-antitoxin module
MKASGSGAEVRVELVDASAPGAPSRHSLHLPASATIRAALAAAGLSDEKIATAVVGVFGRRRELHESLAAGDRIELYRPLLADPKQARRTRVRRT